MENSQWMQFLLGIQCLPTLSSTPIHRFVRNSLYDRNVLGLIRSFQYSSLKLGTYDMKDFGYVSSVHIDPITSNIWTLRWKTDEFGNWYDFKIVVYSSDFGQTVFTISNIGGNCSMRVSLSGSVTVLLPYAVYEMPLVRTYSTLSGSILSTFSLPTSVVLSAFVVIQNSKQDAVTLGFIEGFEHHCVVIKSLEGNDLRRIEVPSFFNPNLNEFVYHAASQAILFAQCSSMHNYCSIFGWNLMDHVGDHGQKQTVFQQGYWSSSRLCHNPKTKHIIVLNTSKIFKIENCGNNDCKIISQTPHHLGSMYGYHSLSIHPFLDCILAATKKTIIVIPYKL